MSPRANHNDDLQAHNIYLENYDSLEEYPLELQDLFKLIVNVSSLKFSHFGGYEPNTSHQLPIRTDAKRQYEKELLCEAIRLTASCTDRQRPDDLEHKWVETLRRIVFYRFDREQEERYERGRHHHW
jgi:hypothetical protein